MPSKPNCNITIYVADEADRAIIRRASKLLQFHDLPGLGNLLTVASKEVVKLYDSNDESK